MTIEVATVADAAEILALQKLAYRSEAEICGDWSIPPLTDTLEAMRAAFARHLVLKAVDAAERLVVGSVRGRIDDAGTCHVGRLIVRPDRQGCGLGAQLLLALESAFPAARRFELFTGVHSERNMHFYPKLGYRAFRHERLSELVTLAFFEKDRTPARDATTR
jgi:GNAT superfamily N-acetyltransferase